MRLAVETWAPEYGAAVEGAVFDEAAVPVDESIELDEGEWEPLRPPPPASVPPIVFVDGVQRIDAVAWVTTSELTVEGRCASLAAGAVRCAPGELAEVVEAEVRRVILCASAEVEPVVTRSGTFDAVVVSDEEEGPALDRALHAARSDLEARVAAAATVAGDLVVADGRLQTSLESTGAVGYVKTHHSRYLSPGGHRVVEALLEGERTPLFRIEGRHPRTSWYARLPGPQAHPWAGVVRLEVAGDRPLAEVAEQADLLTALLPRFASEAHKEGRAPQNLYPIGGLERHLRHRLGDREIVVRALRRAAASAA
jgi:hypothetical protein